MTPATVQPRTTTDPLALVLADARSEGVPERFARRALWLPVAALVVTVATYAYPPLFYLLLRDDRVYEWAQFALVLFSAVVALGAARLRLRQRWWPAAAFLVVVGLGALLLAGEEVSWGQRAFGWTGTALEEVNRQGETNLHNIAAEGLDVEEVFRLAMAAIGLFGLVAPFVVRRPGPRRELLRVLTPPAFLAPCFLMIVGYRTLRFLFEGPTDVTPVEKLQEFAELSLHAALATMVVLLFVHARRSAPRQAADGAPVTRADLRPLFPVAAGVLLLTVVLAVLTALP